MPTSVAGVSAALRVVGKASDAASVGILLKIQNTWTFQVSLVLLLICKMGTIIVLSSTELLWGLNEMNYMSYPGPVYKWQLGRYYFILWLQHGFEQNASRLLVLVDPQCPRLGHVIPLVTNTWKIPACWLEEQPCQREPDSSFLQTDFPAQPGTMPAAAGLVSPLSCCLSFKLERSWERTG